MLFLDRVCSLLRPYAAPNENFAPVVGPHNRPGAQRAPKDTGLVSRHSLRLRPENRRAAQQPLNRRRETEGRSATTLSLASVPSAPTRPELPLRTDPGAHIAVQEMTPASEIHIVALISTRAARISAIRIFVRRGALWRFHRLRRASANLAVSIEWDRREASAPAVGRDRRGNPPLTWELADFVVVEQVPLQRDPPLSK